MMIYSSWVIVHNPFMTVHKSHCPSINPYTTGHNMICGDLHPIRELQQICKNWHSILNVYRGRPAIVKSNQTHLSTFPNTPLSQSHCLPQLLMMNQWSMSLHFPIRAYHHPSPIN